MHANGQAYFNGQAYWLVGGVAACIPYLGLVRVLVNPHRVYGLIFLRRNTIVALDLLTSSSVTSEQ
jgi:hypothetical protein